MPPQQGEPYSAVHLCTPGTTLLSVAPVQIFRCLYTASNGDLYACINRLIFYISPSWVFTSLGAMVGSAPSDSAARYSPVSMSDNGTNILIVDGSIDGWTIDMASRGGFVRIDATVQTGWLGGDRADFSDTYFILNSPGTPSFYTSDSEAVTFDPLNFAGKSAKSDFLVAAVVVHRVLWLLGQYSTEIWFDSGGSGSGSLTTNTFPFEALPGTFFPRGVAAKYSIAQADNQLFWLSQDLTGTGVVMMGSGYDAERISTHSIETAISKYSTIADATGFCYKQQGHTFYVISFPTGDQTWCFDAVSKMWHERCWLDSNGKEHRIRAGCCAFAYNTIVVGDWENGNLYSLDLHNYTDNGMPIKRLRSFPHSIDPEANRRVLYRQFIANMQVGTSAAKANSQTVINTTFDATDGTLLQNYVGTGDIGSTFTQTDTTSNGQIISDGFTGLGGTTAYLASGASLVPDYSIQFQVQPSSYTNIGSSNLYAIGRAIPTTYYGYKAEIAASTTYYNAILTVMPAVSVVTVNMGVIAGGSYAVTLTMQSVSVSMSVQRTIDGFWLTSTGTWSNAQSTAIIISDTTYKLPGRIVIGGSW